MRDGFDALIASLWRSLGLAAPVLGAPARLRVEGRTIEMRLAPDGAQVLVAGSLGRLAADAPGRAAQARRLLRDGLGTLTGNRAALHLAPSGVLEAVASAPCRAGSVPALREAIEDVLHLLDIHSPTLAGGGEADRPGTPLAWSPSESLILRL